MIRASQTVIVALSITDSHTETSFARVSVALSLKMFTGYK